jgi:hypothetical protein
VGCPAGGGGGGQPAAPWRLLERLRRNIAQATQAKKPAREKTMIPTSPIVAFVNAAANSTPRPIATMTANKLTAGLFPPLAGYAATIAARGMRSQPKWMIEMAPKTRQ